MTGINHLTQKWNKRVDNEEDSVKDIPLMYVNYIVIVIIVSEKKKRRLYVSTALHIVETAVRNVAQLFY